MKKLILKEKFSFKKPFRITDENGTELYQIESNMLGTKVSIVDMNGQEVALIEPKGVVSFRFVLTVEGDEPIIIKHKQGLVKSQYEIECQGIEVIGDFWGLNFAIVRNGEKIGAIKNRLGRYEIEVNQETCEFVVLATVVAITYINTANAGVIGGIAGGAAAGAR